MKQKIAFYTLGCKLNYAETSTLAQQAAKNNFNIVSPNTAADIYVLNTCSVTDNADKECKQIIRKFKRLSPSGKIVVIGCYAQLQPQLIAAMPDVDLVLGAQEKFNLIMHLKNLFTYGTEKVFSCGIEQTVHFNSSMSIGSRTRSFLKVQDGCDYPCSYCTIPMARGTSRSNSIQNVIQDIEQIAQQGIKEIVLTGINLGDFGKIDSTSTPSSFFDLIKAIEQHNSSVERFRISSIEPNLLTEDIIKIVAESEKFMPHFHIPLQSGSDKILRLMRRRYVVEKYIRVVEQIKRTMADCAIGVDVIVGFPNESEQDFDDTYKLLSDLDISYLHVFTYSERPNTEALNIHPIVPVEVRQERNQRLRKLSEKKQQLFMHNQKRSIRKVLFEYEQYPNNRMQGYTDNYIRISQPFNAEWVNRIIPIQL